mmetsp:Transcript_13388/g.34236  ORF Transcript_13388/g.34236 Transcript_13388/m.34236 type:complete len:206 (+) Transcript_13388:451-1068(+)
MPCRGLRRCPVDGRRVCFQGLPDRDKVLERLGHLETFDMQVASVKEVRHPLAMAEARLGLREFIVVVRELEINPTGVNIHAWPQDVRRDGRALNVPPWSTLAPRGIPLRFAWLGCFPQHEITRIALLGAVTRQSPLTLGHFFCSCLNTWLQFSVVMPGLLEVGDRQVDRPAGLVRQAVIHDLFYKLHNLVNVLRHASQNIRGSDA